MKHKISIFKSDRILKGELKLPASKSISNRVLMIRALCEGHFLIKNLSDSDDTHLLESLLFKISEYKERSLPLYIDCKDAGTVARFLTTYLALIAKGNFVITGTGRMQQRPMGDLVDSLNSMGAHVSYLEKSGFLPLRIEPPGNLLNEIFVNAAQSSQFVSSVLLVAPLLPKGLKIKLSNEIASKPYIDMTIALMSYFSVEVQTIDNELSVSPQNYKPKDITIESDWSAAAFFYEMASFSEEVEVKLLGLNRNSIQGDSVLSRIFLELGVDTKFDSEGAILTKSHLKNVFFRCNFFETPDIFPSVFVSCALLGIPAHFTGLRNLQHKESDRLAAVTKELEKCGVNVYFDKCKCELILAKRNFNLNKGPIIFKTYNDHRIAMAFAAVSLLNEVVVIDDREVVSKSYPDFWKDMKTLGFEIL